jgi:hypothetical protein
MFVKRFFKVFIQLALWLGGFLTPPDIYYYTTNKQECQGVFEKFFEFWEKILFENFLKKGLTNC